MSTAKPILLLTVLALVTGLIFSGCGGDDPVAPAAPANNQGGGEEEEILIPVTLVISKIYCPRWPEKKPGGSAWDTLGGYPDIYFQIGNCTTNRYDNHQWQVVMHAVFPSPGCRMNYGDTFTVNMWDADSPSADDLMSNATFRPRDLYKNDNAETVNFVLYGSNGSEMYCTGYWIY